MFMSSIKTNDARVGAGTRFDIFNTLDYGKYYSTVLKDYAFCGQLGC